MNYLAGLEVIRWTQILTSVMSISVENYWIKSSKNEKPLGIKVGNKFNFDNYIDEINERVECKLTVLSRATSYMY